MNKYFTDIMPKIRENGKYILDKKSKKELNKVNEKLKLIKKSSEKELTKVNKKLSSIKRSNKDLLLNMKNTK